MSNLYVEGIFSHLATAPQRSDTSYCDMQFEAFSKLLRDLEAAGVKIPIRHISNSGAPSCLTPRQGEDQTRPQKGGSAAEALRARFASE